jgi:SAM-dependent methyltransferase
MNEEISHRRLNRVRSMLGFSKALKRKRLRALGSIVRAVGLGLLPPQELDAFVSESYSSDVDFYHPNVRRDSYEERIVQTLSQRAPGKRLLDAFCGQGREAAILSAAGFNVTGIDNLPAMIDGARNFAESKPFDAQFLVADFDAYKDPQGDGYDVVYTSAWMFSTCPTRRRRHAFLNKCASLCKESGVIVVSYEPLDGSRPLQNRLLDFTSRMTAKLTSGYTSFENGDRLGEAGLFWHLFPKDAVLEEVGASGLQVIHSDHSPDRLLDFLILSK